MLNDNIQYKANENYLLRKIAGEAVLVPVGKGAEQFNGMITLNETFEFIWKQFQKPNTIHEVVEAAKLEYTTEDDMIERDVRRFVAESVQYGFLVNISEEE